LGRPVGPIFVQRTGYSIIRWLCAWLSWLPCEDLHTLCHRGSVYHARHDGLDSLANSLDYNKMDPKVAQDTERPSDVPPANKANKGMEADVNDDEIEHDRLMDTSARQSTRLVKFQLFETKAVCCLLSIPH